MSMHLLLSYLSSTLASILGLIGRLNTLLLKWPNLMQVGIWLQVGIFQDVKDIHWQPSQLVSGLPEFSFCATSPLSARTRLISALETERNMRDCVPLNFF